MSLIFPSFDVNMGESIQDYSWIQDFELESQPQNAEFSRLL